MKMEVVRFSETSLNFCQILRRHVKKTVASDQVTHLLVKWHILSTRVLLEGVSCVFSASAIPCADTFPPMLPLYREDGGSTFLRNVFKFLPDFTASRQEDSCVWPGDTPVSKIAHSEYSCTSGRTFLCFLLILIRRYAMYLLAWSTLTLLKGRLTCEESHTCAVFSRTPSSRPEGLHNYKGVGTVCSKNVRQRRTRSIES